MFSSNASAQLMQCSARHLVIFDHVKLLLETFNQPHPAIPVVHLR